MNKNMKNHLPKILAALPAAALLLTVFAGALVNPKEGLERRPRSARHLG